MLNRTFDLVDEARHAREARRIRLRSISPALTVFSTWYAAATIAGIVRLDSTPLLADLVVVSRGSIGPGFMWFSWARTDFVALTLSSIGVSMGGRMGAFGRSPSQRSSRSPA